jgi:hypothetical protein
MAKRFAGLPKNGFINSGMSKLQQNMLRSFTKVQYCALCGRPLSALAPGLSEEKFMIPNQRQWESENGCHYACYIRKYYQSTM